MYQKIEIKNSTIAFGFQSQRRGAQRLWLFKYYFEKNTVQVGAQTITYDLIVGIQYANHRIRILTQKHRTIKERIE
jgi:hypothetical protein